MARPRSKSREKWPSHLYLKRGHHPKTPGKDTPYYVWRHPKTGEEFGLGSDFKTASIQAMEANLKLVDLLGARRLVDRLEASGKGTVSEFLAVYRKALGSRNLAPNTVKTNSWKLRQIEAGLGANVMERVSTKDLSEFLQPWIDEDQLRAAASVRSMLDDLWKVAAGEGWVKENPVSMLKKISATVKRTRLSLEQFQAIHAKATADGEPWERNLLELALVTAQPRECLVAWEFADWRDGFLWNFRGKTGAKIKIPEGMTVPRIGLRLDDVLRRCRDRIVSKHVLHHARNYTLARVGDPIFIDTATKAFARMRDAAELAWPDGMEPPTLHEVRSLSLRLYKDAHGRDFAQSLAGHKEGSTTDIYTDVRGSEWIEVRLAG